MDQNERRETAGDNVVSMANFKYAWPTIRELRVFSNEHLPEVDDNQEIRQSITYEFLNLS